MDPHQAKLLHPQSPEVEERDARIRELEQRLSRPPSVGVKPWVALFALGVSSWMLWSMRLDAAYFVSSRHPLDIGSEGAYDIGVLRSNVYARVHGIPTTKGAYGLDGRRTFVAVGLRDSPLMIIRSLVEGESWKPGATPRQPDQRPFAVSGRLLKREDALKWVDAFEKISQTNEVTPAWVIVEGDRPGESWSTVAWTTLLGLLVVMNAWFVVRAGLNLLGRGRGQE